MSHVVILSWDLGSRLLTFVELNGGSGSAITTGDVGESSTEHVSAELAGRKLPHTAEMEADGDDVVLDASSGSPVVRCSIRAVGPPSDRRFELRPKGQRAVIAKLPAADLSVNDGSLAGAAETFDYLYSERLTPPGCWICPDGIRTWLSRRQEQRAADRAARNAAEQAREAAQRADQGFINPYTFVPFPERVSRRAPSGHHRLAPENLSGTFTVSWEFICPFQVPDGHSGTAAVRLPGSSVKGAVRSLHETLAGGCLRVFDGDFIPSYRDTAAVRPPSAGWTMAVVDQATRDGQPLAVQLCDDVVWVRVPQLRQACGNALQTGSRISIDPGDVPREPNSLGRKELPAETAVRAGGDWVVLVTDAGTRSVEKGTYFLACGRLGERRAEVTESAWRTFRVAVAGSNDLRPSVRAASAADPAGRRPTIRVTFGSETIGARRVVTGWLWRGDVIWVRIRRVNPTEIVAGELSLAAIWRHPGWNIGPDGRGNPDKWRARNRVPDDVLPCRDPAWLCPSCRIFGSADTSARARDDRAEQRGYAGHVRFGDARSPQPVALEQVRRAPLGAPRPGTGQFYLVYDDPSPARNRDSKPTREWGSGADMPEPRRLRGRKFYWHADPTRQTPPRHIARAHQKQARMAVDQWIAPAGTMLSQRVSFENLSGAELGGLLAALEPQRVLQASADRPLRLHLGGGKPLGLGSCFAKISDLRVWSAQSRYGFAAEVTAEPDGYVAEFTNTCPPEVTATWPALAAVLAEGTVDAERVWYPPGAHWSDRADHEKPFDEPFAFFTGSSGMFLENKPERRLIPLPHPASGDQMLPIIRKDDLKSTRKADRE